MIKMTEIYTNDQKRLKYTLTTKKAQICTND